MFIYLCFTLSSEMTLFCNNIQVITLSEHNKLNIISTTILMKTFVYGNLWSYKADNKFYNHLSYIGFFIFQFFCSQKDEKQKSSEITIPLKLLRLET